MHMKALVDLPVHISNPVNTRQLLMMQAVNTQQSVGSPMKPQTDAEAAGDSSVLQHSPPARWEGRCPAVLHCLRVQACRKQMQARLQGTASKRLS